jgi:hypothetical protein
MKTSDREGLCGSFCALCGHDLEQRQIPTLFRFTTSLSFIFSVPPEGSGRIGRFIGISNKVLTFSINAGMTYFILRQDSVAKATLLEVALCALSCMSCSRPTTAFSLHFHKRPQAIPLPVLPCLPAPHNRPCSLRGKLVWGGWGNQVRQNVITAGPPKPSISKDFVITSSYLFSVTVFFSPFSWSL